MLCYLYVSIHRKNVQTQSFIGNFTIKNKIEFVWFQVNFGTQRKN